jgi:hypothetical protein
VIQAIEINSLSDRHFWLEGYDKAVAEAGALARSEEFDAYQMLSEHYAGIRRWAPAFLDAFVFEGRLQRR